MRDRLEHLELACRQSQKKLLIAWFRRLWSGHVQDPPTEDRILIRFSVEVVVVRRWWQWIRKAKPMSSPADRIALSSVLAESAGKWVAVDRATNEPRLMAESPYELAAEIRRRGLRNVAVVRGPDPSEPELVGLG